MRDDSIEIVERQGMQEARTLKKKEELGIQNIGTREVLVMERAISVSEEIEKVRIERSLERQTLRERNNDEKYENWEEKEHFEKELKVAEMEKKRSEEEYRIRAEKEFERYFGNRRKYEDEKSVVKKDLEMFEKKEEGEH